MARSGEATGIPIAFITKVFEPVIDVAWRRVYLLAGLLRHDTFLALVQRAAETDVAECYDMKDTWARGRIVTGRRQPWTARPEHQAWLVRTAAACQEDIAELVQFDLSLRFKATKGECVNPERPEQLIVAYVSTADRELRWYDATPRAPIARDDPHVCSYCCNAPRGFGPRHLPKCRGCLQRRYCSDACQRADWPVHAGECAPAAAAL